MTGGKRRARALASASLLACHGLAGCGSRDEPRGSSPEPEPEGSRIWGVLSDPESIDALCRIAGVSAGSVSAGSVSAGAAAAGAADCDAIVDQCRDVASALGGLGLGSAPSDVDLEPLLGCSVTASQLDACLAQVLERGIELYGAGVSCAAPELPEVDPASLALAPACLGVALRCPELLGSMF